MRRAWVIVALLAGCSAPAVPSSSSGPELVLRAVAPTTTSVPVGPTRPSLAVELHRGHVRMLAHAARVQRAREQAATALVSLDPTRAPDWPLWRCTALHEAGCVCWANDVGPFAGPFDIAVSTWRAKAPRWIVTRWPRASWAPPWAQVVAARVVRARVGSGQWGGLRACGG